MLEQAKRPDSTPRRPSSASGPDGAIRRPMDRKVDPFGLQLEPPDSRSQAKMASCSTCGGIGSCSTCGREQELAPPPAVARRAFEEIQPHPAERQADAIGKQIAMGMPSASVAGTGTLPAGPQQRAEEVLGVDLGSVRLDASPSAQQRASEDRALAVTEANRISFAEDQLDLGTREGRQLLGHELVHVAQQRAHGVGHQRKEAQSDGKEADAGASESQPHSASEKKHKGPTVKLPTTGVTLSTSASAVETELIEAIERLGDADAVTKVNTEYESLYGISDDLPPGGAPDPNAPGEELRDLKSVLATAAARVSKKKETWEFDFGVKLSAIFYALMEDSEQTLDDEVERYGLKELKGVGPGCAEGPEGCKGTMDTTVGGAGLIGAASEIYKRRRAIAKLREDIDSPDKGNRYKENLEKLPQAELELEAYEEMARARYPILASLGFAQLGALASQRLTGGEGGQTPLTAAILLAEVQKRRTNIKTVKEGEANGSLSLWKLDKLMALGIASSRWAPKSAKTLTVQARSGREQTAELLRSLGVAALSIALTAGAAALTGGAGAGVGAAAGGALFGASVGISIAELKRDVDAYQLESAASNTDFDRANAVIAEEPSPFWLALSVVGVVADVAAAAKLVRTIKPTIAAAEAAPTEAKFVEELGKLSKQAPKGLGENLVAMLRKFRARRAAAKTVSDQGLELRALKEAEKQLSKGTPLVEVHAAGHTVRVFPSGLIYMCSRCTSFTERVYGWLTKLEKWRDQGFLTPAEFKTYRRRIGKIATAARTVAAETTEKGLSPAGEKALKDAAAQAALLDGYMSKRIVMIAKEGDVRGASYAMRAILDLLTRKAWAGKPEEAIQQLLIALEKIRVHHLVPKELKKKVALVRLAAKNGYDINRLKNLTVLPSFEMDDAAHLLLEAMAETKITRLPGHTKYHRIYSDFMIAQARRLERNLVVAGRKNGLSTLDEIARKRPEWIAKAMNDLEEQGRTQILSLGAESVKSVQ